MEAGEVIGELVELPVCEAAPRLTPDEVRAAVADRVSGVVAAALAASPPPDRPVAVLSLRARA